MREEKKQWKVEAEGRDFSLFFRVSNILFLLLVLDTYENMKLSTYSCYDFIFIVLSVVIKKTMKFIVSLTFPMLSKVNVKNFNLAR